MREGDVIRIDGVRWWLAPDAPAAAASRTIRAALAAHARGDAPNLKSGRRKQLYALTLGPGAAPDYLLKVNEYPFGSGILRLLRRSKSRRELRTASLVAARGLPAPVPLAAGERRRLGRLTACYLLIPVLEDVADLRQLWFEAAPSPRQRRTLATALGVFSRRVHDGGFFQDDFAPNNILVTSGRSPSFLLIDFERAQLHGRVSRRMQRWMLAKLSRHMDDATAAERMRFIKAYVEGDRREARRWWHEIAAFAPRLALRDHRRMRRNCVTDGRNFMRLREKGARGFARRGIDLARLGAASAPDQSPAADPAPRILADGTLWRVVYGPLRAREGREIWARANTLWAWGRLGPRPLALLWRQGAATLFMERNEAGPLPREAKGRDGAAGALRVLLNRLAAVSVANLSLDPAAIVIEPVGRWPLRAILLAPHAVKFCGRRMPGRDLKTLTDRLLSAWKGASSSPSA